MALDRDNFKRTSSVDFGDWLTNAAQAIQPGISESLTSASRAPASPVQPLRQSAAIVPAMPGVPKPTPALQKAITPSHRQTAMLRRLSVSPRSVADIEGIVVKKMSTPKSQPIVAPTKPALAALASPKPSRQPIAQKVSSVRAAQPKKVAISQNARAVLYARSAHDAERLPIITDASEDDVLFPLQAQYKKRPWKYILWPLGMTALFAVSFGLAGLTSQRGMQHASGNPQVQGAQTVATNQEDAAGSSEIPLSASDAPVASVGQAISANASVPASQQRKSVLKGVEVAITTQPLPSSYGGDPGALQQVAMNMGAQESFTSAKWGTVYVLTKGNEQAVLCANAQQLIVAQVTTRIALDDWKPFIETL